MTKKKNRDKNLQFLPQGSYSSPSLLPPSHLPAHFMAFFLKSPTYRTSLVAQWLRICLPMQGKRVRALVQEDPTCHEATKPMSHNY